MGELGSSVLSYILTVGYKLTVSDVLPSFRTCLEGCISYTMLYGEEKVQRFS